MPRAGRGGEGGFGGPQLFRGRPVSLSEPDAEADRREYAGCSEDSLPAWRHGTRPGESWVGSSDRISPAARTQAQRGGEVGVNSTRPAGIPLRPPAAAASRGHPLRDHRPHARPPVPPVPGLAGPARSGRDSGCDVPEPYHRLLVHTHHMTVTVEEFYGAPVDVRVLTLPSRRKRVRPQDSAHRSRDAPGRAVRPRADRPRRVSRRGARRDRRGEDSARPRADSARHAAADRAGRVPAGALRREMAEWFGVAAGATTYGRLGVIYTGDRPAVEVLGTRSACPVVGRVKAGADPTACLPRVEGRRVCASLDPTYNSRCAAVPRAATAKMIGYSFSKYHSLAK